MMRKVKYIDPDALSDRVLSRPCLGGEGLADKGHGRRFVIVRTGERSAGDQWFSERAEVIRADELRDDVRQRIAPFDGERSGVTKRRANRVSTCHTDSLRLWKPRKLRDDPIAELTHRDR